MADHCTLLVKHLPAELSPDDCEDFLRHFDASHVRYMGARGRMKHCAFATFESADSAANALRRLHQLEVLGTRLSAEFSAKSSSDHHPSALENVKCKSDDVVADPAVNSATGGEGKMAEQEERERDKKVAIAQKLNSMCSKWNVDYPINPKLQYMYPAPTITILTNIANALATVPRFYVQVLHLMNKMNLPAPFAAQTLTPPLPVGGASAAPPLPKDDSSLAPPPQEPDTLEEVDMAFSSTEESELETEDEAVAKKNKSSGVAAVSTKRPRRKERKVTTRKRLKLQLQMQAQMQAVAGILPPGRLSSVQPGDVFEPVEHAAATKRIEFKLSTDDAAVESLTAASEQGADSEVTAAGPPVIVEEGGFGRMEPERRQESDEENPEEELGETEFISSRRLRDGRLSRSAMRDLAVFKNYEPGDMSSRLYIKNLARQVTEKDLHYVYGRYVDWGSETERMSFYKQLMNSGRMKGQAFITLPSEEMTRRALEETNGYVLLGKPMVVSFARSAKPKDKDSAAATDK